MICSPILSNLQRFSNLCKLRMPIIVQYDFHLQKQISFNKLSKSSFKILPLAIKYHQLEKYLKFGANMSPYHTLSFCLKWQKINRNSNKTVFIMLKPVFILCSMFSNSRHVFQDIKNSNINFYANTLRNMYAKFQLIPCSDFRGEDL